MWGLTSPTWCQKVAKVCEGFHSYIYICMCAHMKSPRAPNKFEERAPISNYHMCYWIVIEICIFLNPWPTPFDSLTYPLWWIKNPPPLVNKKLSRKLIPRVCVDTHVYIYSYMCTYMCTYIHVYRYTYMCAYIHTYICIYTHRVRAFPHACVYVYWT